MEITATPIPFYLSKTLWFNALTVIVAIAGYYGYVGNKELSDAIVAGIGIINIILRTITTQPVSIN